jgi:hypothetical protein
VPRAVLVGLLLPKRNVIGKALREPHPRYAASTYALCEALYDQKKDSPVEAVCEPGVLLYANRRGLQSLEEGDDQWLKIETPDRTGFRGLTGAAPVRLYRDAACFSPAGFNIKNGVEYLAVDGDVIAIESKADDEHGSHAAIMLSR